MTISKVYNIAYGVFLGVAICAIAYSWNEAGQFEVTVSDESEEGKKIYDIEGPLFFAAANRLVNLVNADTDPDIVEVRFGHTSIMDYTAIATLQKIASEYKAKGKSITYKSLNQSSQKIIAKANALAGAIEWKPKEGSV